MFSILANSMAAITNEILGKKRKGEKDEDRETDRNLKKKSVQRVIYNRISMSGVIYITENLFNPH